MASAITKILVMKTMKEAAQKNFNSQNPYEEEVPVLDRSGRPTGKYKTRKRGLPPGLSFNDCEVLKKVRRRAYRLDMALFNLCGIRFGWSSVIGLIPVAGDILDGFLAIMLVRSADQIDGGLPSTLKSKMMINIILDFSVGLIPFIGDIFDAFFRANTRNTWLLEVYLTKNAEAEQKGRVSDPELGEDLVKPAPAQTQSRGNISSYRTHPNEEMGHDRHHGPSLPRSDWSNSHRHNHHRSGSDHSEQRLRRYSSFSKQEKRGARR